MKYMVCKVSNNDTPRSVIDTLQPVFGIPLILPADTMIMLEVKDQQDNLIKFFKALLGETTNGVFFDA